MAGKTGRCDKPVMGGDAKESIWALIDVAEIILAALEVIVTLLGV